MIVIVMCLFWVCMHTFLALSLDGPAARDHVIMAEAWTAVLFIILTIRGRRP